MKRAFVGLTCLTILLAIILIGGASLGAAQTVGGARPTATVALPGPGSGETLPSSPASPDALPDLIVTEIRVSPENPKVDGAATVFVTIMNASDVEIALGNNFFLDLYINPTTDDLRYLPGDFWWDVQGHWMKPWLPVEFSTSVAGVFDDTGSYDLWAQVDRAESDPPYPLGYVIESDEENNVLGPESVTVRTRFAWVQQDHVDFFSNMASTLDIVPIEGTVGIPPEIPGLEISGDSALALGVFDEPPYTTWGDSGNSDDYNMIYPDFMVNAVTDEDQRYPFVHADLATGLVVVVWEDSQNGPTWGKDVYLRWSDDEGETWYPNEVSDPACALDPADCAIRVNEDVGYADQKLPSVAVAPNGNIVVAWQDNRSGNFDIYVQVYGYDGGALVPEGGNSRVDTGASDQDQILPDISVDNESNFYVAWQDRRNYNYDIFAVRSYYSVDPCPPIAPDLGFYPESALSGSEIQAIDADGLYLCWGYDARISDDPGITTQAVPDITALQGVQVQDILYEVTGDPPVLNVTDVVLADVAYVVVTWEDDREGDLDIYMTYSEDGGETFVQDRRLNDDKPANSTNGFKQQTPAVAINQWMKFITISKDTPYGTASTSVEVPVTTMHIVWQDFRNSTPGTNDDPDIYYTTIDVEPDGDFPWPVQFQFGGQERVNDDDQRAWQTGKVRQSDPDVSATSSGLTLGDSDSYNAFVTWSDWRNYGAGVLANPDIYFRLFSTVGTPTEFVGGNNVMVNNNARLHNFTPGIYEGYSEDMPPHAQQRHPSVSSTLVANWPTIFDGWVFVVWDDDRISEPFTDYDVYLARSNMLFGGHGEVFTAPGDVPGEGERYGAGAFVSRIFDGGSADSKWYYIDWHAITDDGTYITLQTRMGNTPTEVLASDWYPERYPYPNDAVNLGAPLQGYDAPGQHIENASGDTCPDNCPTARYIQYRVNFWARDAEPDPGVTVLNTPFLFDVTLGYEPPYRIYMPLMLRNSH